MVMGSIGCGRLRGERRGDVRVRFREGIILVLGDECHTSSGNWGIKFLVADRRSTRSLNCNLRADLDKSKRSFAPHGFVEQDALPCGHS
jgi:hypothetical protein